MRRRLLEYLVCPGCGSTFDCRVEAESGGEIESAKLECTGCSRSDPVVRGIPRFVRSRPEPQDDALRTIDAFGWEWREFDVLHDLETYESQFLDWIHPIQPSFFEGKIVLDAGCGMGRFSRVAARFGAELVLAVDASDAVEAAHANTRDCPAIQVIQADLRRLPLRDGADTQMDFVFSIGVLHHLPDPKGGFLALARHVRREGSLFAWVYGRENNGWLVHLIDPLRTHVTSRLPRRALYSLAFVLTAGLHPLSKTLYSHRNPAWLLRRLPYGTYLSWMGRFGFRHNHSIVFDHLAPSISSYIRREEFRSWFDEAEMEIIDLSWRNRNSWRGHGRPKRIG